MSTTPRVHPGIRLGGAFLAIAVALAVMFFISASTKGLNSAVAVTPRLLLIVVAAALVGAFAPRVPGVEPTATRGAALAIALVAVVASRFIPNPEIHVMHSAWLLLYGGVALCASLLLRMQVTRAS